MRGGSVAVWVLICVVCVFVVKNISTNAFIDLVERHALSELKIISIDTAVAQSQRPQVDRNEPGVAERVGLFSSTFSASRAGTSSSPVLITLPASNSVIESIPFPTSITASTTVQASEDSKISACHASKVVNIAPLRPEDMKHYRWAKNFTKKTHCEWWTLAEKAALPALPQCNGGYRVVDAVVNAKRYRYTGPGSGRSSYDLEVALGRRHVIIVGDSLSNQMWAALECYLTKHWTNFSDTRRWAKVFAINKEMQRKYDGSHIGHQFPGKPYESYYWGRIDTSVGGTFEFYGDIGMTEYGEMDLLIKYVLGLPVDLIIFNFGIHHHGLRRERSLKQQLAMVMEECKQFGASCAFRETTPQHFPGPSGTGLWEDCGQPRLLCGGAVWRSYNPGAEWRNEDIFAAAREAGFDVARATLWKVFDALMPRGDAHDGGDCSHYGKNIRGHGQTVVELWEPAFLDLIDMLSAKI